jgi:hypothetical protein
MLMSPDSMDSASASGWSARHSKMREVLGEPSVDMQALQVPVLPVRGGRVVCRVTAATETCLEWHSAQLPQQRVEDHAGTHSAPLLHRT